ncbi:hypothetical protein CBC_A1512 [Clostridium botulinum C str. Eklund]|nr:hypothetical protein CBC_A1512 [Clostridium botulinum C str. Eklund]
MTIVAIPRLLFLLTMDKNININKIILDDITYLLKSSIIYNTNFFQV